MLVYVREKKGETARGVFILLVSVCKADR